MSLTRWEPFRELEEMSTRLNRLFNPPFSRQLSDDSGLTLAAWTPAMDVQEVDGEYLIKADLPDVQKQDVHVEIRDGVLSVSGERRQEKEESGRKFHRVERAYGRFERRMALPTEVDAQKVAAEFKDGVLHVHLPKAPAARPQSIAVKVN
jgi:HSP20 family protein